MQRCHWRIKVDILWCWSPTSILIHKIGKHVWVIFIWSLSGEMPSILFGLIYFSATSASSRSNRAKPVPDDSLPPGVISTSPGLLPINHGAEYGHCDGLVQDSSIHSALAMEILWFCIKPPIYFCLDTIISYLRNWNKKQRPISKK